MRTTLNPIMLCLFAALAAPAVAVEHGPISLVSPTSEDVTTTLNSGDTVTTTSGYAAHVTGTNKLIGDGVTFSAGGAADAGLVAAGGGVISLTNSIISMSDTTGGHSGQAPAVYAVGGGRVELEGGSVTTNTGHGLVAEASNAVLTAKDVTVTVSEKVSVAGSLFGVLSLGGASVTVEDSRIVTVGGRTHAAGVSGDSTLSLRNTDIISEGREAAVLVHDGGRLTMTGGSIKSAVDGAAGISIGVSPGSQAIDTSATLAGVNITMDGAGAIALSAGGMSIGGGELSLFNSDVKTTGEDSYGLLAGNQSRVTLDNTRISTEGVNAYGIASFNHSTGGQDATETVIRNGSQISTQNAAALATGAGPQTFLVSDSIIIGRAAGAIDGGVLLHATAFNLDLVSERVLLDASHSLLTGDVLADSGTVSANLKDGTVLTGAVVEGARGRVTELAVDGTSAWRVRGDSSLGTLKNDGVVAFVAPNTGTGFKTVTVNNYVGGGTLVVNTRLGDDASPTDKLVIDGGTASGNTSLRVINAGGVGGQTQEGIRIVQTINGGTTAVDAFRLDAGSTGYRASSDMLSLNGYEYSLMRGGNGGQAQDWYLAYDDTPVFQITDDGADKPTGKPSYKNVSPESGAFAGNQLASTRLFTHGLYDRVSGYMGDDAASRGRGVWTRVQGRRDSGLGMSEGRVDVTTDSSVVQLGVDLLKTDLGSTGALYAGLMGGYGDARVRSTSTLARPTGGTVQARTDGKVSGHSVGLYGTYYQNDATRLGAYADTWLQWGRYSNQLNSELGSARYDSTVVSASLEAGYAMTPFASGSMLESIVVQPHVQMTYSRYDAQDVTLQGTRMRSGSNDTVDARVGVRVYPQAAAAPAVRPFLEANWLHGFGNPSVKMGSNVLDTKVSRNNLELKLGAEGYVGRSVKMSGHVFGQAGSNNQRGYGGMINLGYRW